jgi:hypothetical protein
MQTHQNENSFKEDVMSLLSKLGKKYLSKVIASEEEAKAYKITLTVCCPSEFKPHKISMLQSPGAIDYLGDYKQSADFDPFIEDMKVEDMNLTPEMKEDIRS